jgi:hypothetical protein
MGGCLTVHVATTLLQTREKLPVGVHIKDAPTFLPPWEGGSWSIVLGYGALSRPGQQGRVIPELESFLLFSSNRLHKERRVRITSERYAHLDAVVDIPEVEAVEVK